MVSLLLSLQLTAVVAFKSPASLNLNLEAVTIPIKTRLLQLLQNVPIYGLEHDAKADDAIPPLWGTIASVKPGSGLKP